MADSSSDFYTEAWFEPVFIGICILVLAFMFYTFMPEVHFNSQVAKQIGMATMVADGRLIDAYAAFNIPPFHPLLMGLMIRIGHLTDLVQMVELFRYINLFCILGFLTGVYLFLKRHMETPFTYVITGLVLLAPSTLKMAWMMDTQALYSMMSMLTLLVVDISLSQHSEMGSELSKRETVLCGGLLGLTVLSWQVGYLLLFSFFIVCWRRFGFQRGLMLLSVITLFISPFIARDAYGVFKNPTTYMTPTINIMRSFSRNGVINTLQQQGNNVTHTLATQTVGDILLDPFEQNDRNPYISRKTTLMKRPWVRWVIGFVALVGAFYGLKQYTGLGSIYLSVYVISALVLLPRGFNPGIAPVLPLLLFYLYYGLMYTGNWMKQIEMPLLSKVIPPAITVWILLCTLSNHIGLAKSGYLHRFRQGGVAHLIYLSTAKPARDRLQAAQKNTAHRRSQLWLQDRLRLSHIPRSVPESSVNTLVFYGKPIDYLIMESNRKIRHPRKQYYKGLTLVYEDLSGRIQIWQVNQPLT